jgi:hypothetical protein
MSIRLTYVKQTASDPSEERNLILKDGKVIAEVVHNDMEWEEFEKNTKELVDRYNAHGELLDAIEQVLTASEDNGDMEDIDWKTLQELYSRFRK